jgi:ribosomal protein L34
VLPEFDPQHYKEKKNAGFRARVHNCNASYCGGREVGGSRSEASWGWESSSVIEHLPSMLSLLGRRFNPQNCKRSYHLLSYYVVVLEDVKL